jgi:hypothetical protein
MPTHLPSFWFGLKAASTEWTSKILGIEYPGQPLFTRLKRPRDVAAGRSESRCQIRNS